MTPHQTILAVDAEASVRRPFNAVSTELRTLDSIGGLIGISGNEEALFTDPLIAKLLKKHVSLGHELELGKNAVRLAEERRRR